MIALDLNRAIEDQHYWPGVRIYTRFASLERYRDLLAEYVPLMQNQTLVRWQAERARSALPTNRAEQQELEDDLTVRLEHDISNNFYSAYLIPLSAALESSLLDLCTYVQAREALPLKVSDLREPGTVKRALVYLQLCLRDMPAIDNAVLLVLRELQSVRNALAHTNGQLDEQQPTRRQELEALARTDHGVKIWDDHVIVQVEFLQRATCAAEQLLNQLLRVVADAYPVAPRSAP